MRFFLKCSYVRTFICQLVSHKLCGNVCHVDVTYFRNKRYSTGCTWICFQYINLIFADCVLHIHKTYNTHFTCDCSCVFSDEFFILFRNFNRRNNTSGVTGVNTCLFNVLHNSRNKCVCAIRDSVCFTF